MLSSSLKPPTVFRHRPLHHAKNRPVGSSTDHQIRLREAQAQRNQSSAHVGMIVSVLAAQDSFCSSIGDLTFDGEGSSRHCLFSANASHLSDDVTSQQSSIAENAAPHERQHPSTAPDTMFSPVDGKFQKPNEHNIKPQEDHSTFSKDYGHSSSGNENVESTLHTDNLGSGRSKSDQSNLEKQPHIKEEIPIPLSRWRRRDGENNKIDVKPIKRFASLSPVKRERSKELTLQTLHLREAQEMDLPRPLEMSTDRRSRSESEVKTSKQTTRPVQRNRSEGERPFQFLQRMKLKLKNSGKETEELRALAHACEADKMMNYIAGNNSEFPAPRNPKTNPLAAHRPTPLLRKQRSKSRIESSKLQQMAHSLSPSKTIRRKSLLGNKQECCFESKDHVGDDRPDMSMRRDFSLSPRRKHRPMKKQRSRSLLFSAELTAMEVALPKLSKDESPRKPRARRVVSMTDIDSPPRIPRRAQSGRKPPPTTSQSFDYSLARVRDEDWQIASLDEESTTVESNSVLNTDTVCPLNKQEDEMILLALERSLEDPGPSLAPSHDSTANSLTTGNCTSVPSETGSLFWIKEDSLKWVALSGVSFVNEESSEEDEMLAKVLKSSAMEMMKRVHMQLLGVKRPPLGYGVTFA